MSKDTLSNPNTSRDLNIFVTEADKNSRNLRDISDFMSNGINSLTHELIDETCTPIVNVRKSDIALVGEALMSGGPIVQNGYEYILDFDSLPKDVLSKLRKGIYKLGKSRQVDGNLRAVIVDETGTRIKDLTLKRGKTTNISVANMQDIAIQAQLRQIDLKLDTIIELQGYQIDLARNNDLILPFFNARGEVIHAQNEPRTYSKKRRDYLDNAVREIEHGINAVYLDIDNIQKRFLRLTRWPIPPNGMINQYIGYIAQDLQLLAKYNSVLFQIYDYMGKENDKNNAFKVYRDRMLEFYTKAVGPKQLPFSLQIHNAFDATHALDRNIWKTMTDEMAPMLQNISEINGVIIVSMEDDSNEG